ncbi:MAG: AbrB family transcriptional regulator [Anaerolineae bacterium]
MKSEDWPAELAQGLALLAAGTAGALAGWAVGIPAGIMVGALLICGLYRLAGGEQLVGGRRPAESQRLADGQLDRWRKRYARLGRLLLGIVIGAAFGPDMIAPLKAALLPMAGLVVAIICVGLFLGWLLNRLTGLDLATSIISAVPGGLPAMTAMAEDVDADATVVTAIHFSRLTTILVAIPALFRMLPESLPGSAATAPGEPVGLGATVIALTLGLLAGALALRFRVPTGDLVGPILVVGGINLLGGGIGPLAPGFRQAAMLFIGISVGVQMSRQSLHRLRQVALPAAIMIVTLISAGLLMGWGLSRLTTLDLVSALLSGVPGGASTMPLIAHDVGGDMRLVAALHLMRQLVMLVLVPLTLGYLFRNRRHERAIAPKLHTGG